MSAPREGTRGPLTTALAAEIRAERNALRMTQPDVWTAADIPRSTYVKIESAASDIDIAQLAKIAPALRLTVSELVERAEKRAARSESDE